MRNKLFTATALTGMVALLTFGNASAAFADEVNDSVAALKNSNVYIDSSVTTTAASEIASIYQGSDIAVVVLNGGTVGNNTNWTADSAANYILSNSQGFDTVILATNGVTPFVVKGENAEEISEILYAGYSGDFGVELFNDSDSIFDLVESTSTSEISPIADVGIVAAIGLGIVAAVAVGGFFFMLILSRTPRGARNAAKRGKLKAVTTKALSNRDLEVQLEKLAHIAGRLFQNNSSKLGEITSSIVTHLNELLTRLKRRDSGNQLDLAQVEYADVLKKLNDALGDDYYFDIVKNPSLWDDAESRKNEVEIAVGAVDTQILENIKQVNAYKDLDFRVALESILRQNNNPKARNMIADR